jgi:hypothetical protein
MSTEKETKERSKFAIFSVNNRFVIKDLNEEQWYVRTYKGHKVPNFVSCTGYARKYKCWLIAQIRAWILGNCVVQTCC